VCPTLPGKPCLACPVKCETLFNRVGVDANRLYEFWPHMFAMSVGAHSCAMHSRLKAAPTITISAREILGFSCARTSLKEVTIVLGVNWRITEKQDKRDYLRLNIQWR